MPVPRGLLGSVEVAALQGASPPPPPAPAPLFSMRAGRELARRQLSRHRAVAAAAFSARWSHAAGAVTTE